MRLVAAGLSFHSAPLALRERAVISDVEAPNLLKYLVGHPGVSGAAVLSTCNRTDFYVSVETDALAGDVANKLGRYLDPGNDRLAEHLVAHHDAAAIEHMCRVAAGLDSMVLGEAQVLGQFRSAHRLAADAGTLSSELDVALRGAIETAKHVRTTTALGRGTASLSEVALDLAREVLGDLNGVCVLLIGAGKMSRLSARRLQSQGARILVTSRSASAQRLAAELGAAAVNRDEIINVIADVDLVITSTSAPGTVVSSRDVAVWQATRQGRPLCIVDLAVPRDVEAAAADVSGVRLVDIDELGGHVDAGIESRRRAVPEAHAIVAADVIAILERVRSRSTAAPTIAALVDHAETVRHADVERTLARLPGLDAAGVAQIHAMSRSIVRKLLHGPIDHVRTHADDAAAVKTVRAIFDLDDIDTDHDAKAEVLGRASRAAVTP